MTNVAGGLITLEDMLEVLKYGNKQTPPDGEQLSARDAGIAHYIQAATPVIEKIIGSPLLPRTETQRRDGGKLAVLLSGRLTDDNVLAVRVDGQTWDGYVVDVDSAILYAGGGRRFPEGLRNVEIDVAAGTAPIPETLKIAVRRLVRHWIQNGDQAPRADSVNPNGADSPLPGDEWAIPRSVWQLCAPFVTGTGFA